MTVSFSGAHPFRPQCLLDWYHAAGLPAHVLREHGLTGLAKEELDGLVLGLEPVDVAADVAAAVDEGRCPRCAGPLARPREIPAGSRLLPCRCLPVCGDCGAEEARRGPGDPCDWPFNREEMLNYLASLPGESVTALVVPDGAGGATIVGPDGVGPLRPRPDPGGWLDHGYDDRDDEQERRGR